MKKIFLTFCLLLCYITSLNAQEATVLLVSTKGKNAVAYLLKDNPVITFGSQVFEVKFNNTTDSYSYAEIDNISYVSENDIAESGICLVDFDMPTIKYKHNSLTVITPKKCIVKILDASGKQCFYKKLKSNSTEVIDIKHLKDGVYILSIDSITFKFSI